MKNLLQHALLVVTLSAGFTALAHAQAPTDPAQPVQRPHQHWVQNPDHQTKMLAKRLGLSPEQAAQIEPILANRDQQLKALRDNTGLDPKAARQQMRGIQQDTNTKVTALINDAQKQQYQQLLAERHHGRGGWKQGSQAPASSSPTA
jgi:Spy/CpxP family protein refolding chaperone